MSWLSVDGLGRQRGLYDVLWEEADVHEQATLYMAGACARMCVSACMYTCF